MKILRFQFLVFVALLAIFSLPSRADDCSCNPLELVFKAQVLSVENQRYTAMSKADTGTLDKLLASNLVYAHSNGQVQTKNELLDDLKTGKMRYRKIEPLPPMVRFFGDTAIVNGAGNFEVTLNNVDQKARLVFTAVYILTGEATNRNWQLASWHSSAPAIKPAQ